MPSRVGRRSRRRAGAGLHSPRASAPTGRVPPRAQLRHKGDGAPGRRSQPGRVRAVVAVVEWDAQALIVVAVAAGAELMQMGVVPGEGALDGDVHAPERAVARYLDATPDQRLDMQKLERS